MDLELLAQLHDLAHYRRFGKYRGKVTSNTDDTHRGRLKVTVPAVLGEGVDVWAEACVPYAGDQVGWFAMPPVGAGVWVEFEGGDPSYPIWTGCFWADGQAPGGGDPQVKLWKTAALTLTLDDQHDEAALATSSHASITLTSEVVTAATAGKHTVAPGGVTSTAGGGVKLEVLPAAVIVTGPFEAT